MTRIEYACALLRLLRRRQGIPPLGRYLVLLSIAAHGGKASTSQIRAIVGDADQYSSTLTTAEQIGQVRGDRTNPQIIWHLTEAGQRECERLLKGLPAPVSAQ